VLTGYRSPEKENYPNQLGLVGGAIAKFESPINAAVRALEQKANLKIKIEDNTTEPAHITIFSGDKPIIADMSFQNIYSDPIIAGETGGSSQCFAINVKDSPTKFKTLKDMGDMTDIAFRPAFEVLKEGLAYQQSKMLEEALRRI
jgi:hypothetical protein